MTLPTVDQQIDSTRKALWLAAIKPPMYSVAIIPILVGSLLAYGETGVLNGRILAIFLLSAVLLLMWENLSNDVYDADTGIDKNKHHSLVNLTQNQSLIFWLGNLSLGLGVAGVLSITLIQQDFTVLGLILICCALGYIYQGPPFRLGYQGLGEPLCFLSFTLGVAAAYYAQAQTFSLGCWGLGAMVGMATTLVLFCSHFHQVKDDVAAGKCSPIVRIGTLGGAKLLPYLCGSIFVILLGGLATGIFSPSLALVLASAPFAVQLCRHVMRYHDQPQLVQNAKFVAIRFQFCCGILICLALLLSAGLQSI
ncbi:2-carboxy-1,4-naphthoquinone phytyltransferase [Leptothoe kymatousa]|uniref:2-carboxy-1,4-naphthoquinone phytyltransferase n=1 Tax=Leptothoe kymatousa TAU-MAC 1615 TaxID=2364775 RepID=A0ABS5Y286_9CYAN|nr:2-carboxy-1,4-naphthoquinone phytyltransferase [Leptothoe kymatousa]MBT9311925.1 2-carboxy-1,4-naphthoquinone phytyltransferase [Leptothoe kymatousa TAU-MAC 1615]